MDSIMICCDKAPHGTNITAEALRIAAGLLGLGPTIECVVVFDEDAVYFLTKNNDIGALGVDPLTEPLELLELTDAKIFVVESALEQRGLTRNDLIDYPLMEIISLQQLAEMIPTYSTAFHM
jgi:sulfur relay (sulfurtransferase) DsrF/TusC family protein